MKKRFAIHLKEPDARSYSFPNLSKAEAMDQVVAEHHNQQGSDPNLLSDSFQDNAGMQRKVSKARL